VTAPPPDISCTFRRVALSLRQGIPADPQDSAYVADTLLALAAGDTSEVAGMFEDGARSPTARQERDAALRRALQLTPGVSARERTRYLCSHMARYFESSRYRDHDRIVASCPYDAGTLDAAVWRSLRAVPSPPSCSTIWRAHG
jgi:hypothetical protein